ncbi:hypothetical protein RF11_06980 [Thelohanellus kitauei]|uniref:Tc1-like transposase DDE domain-containing protein n=1 Tax=Thelohanellus kitauei TaxID=669202 RepID=A0A0C2N2R5_THEKT|nr:hypothetical protein RF11_06980 [Thelohanellus kitauei]
MNTTPLPQIDNPNVDESLNTGDPTVPRGRSSYQKISDERRQRIINAHQNGSTVKNVSEYENLPRSTIQNIVKKYSETGRISKENRGGRTHFKVNEEIKTFIRELVDENCGLSLKQICQNVATRFDITLSETTIHNCLGQMHYSLKAIHIIPTRRNDPNTICIRNHFAHSFLRLEENYPDEQIYFVDEVGFNVSMRIKRGRSSIGTTPILRVPNIRSRNVSVCCAMNRYGVVFKEINNRPYNT